LKRGGWPAGLLAAVATGVLAAAAFPPVGAWPLILLAPAPLAAALEGVRPGKALLLGWLAYGLFGLLVVHWLVEALHGEYGVAAAAAWAVTGGVVFVYALVPAFACAGHAWLRPRASAATAPLLFAAWAALAEWLRAVPLALPWLLFGHALAPVPAAIQLAEGFGAFGISFGVFAVGAGIGIAVRSRRPAPLVSGAAVAVVALGFGAVRLGTLAPAAPGADGFEVGIVQASVPQSDRFQPGSAARNTRRHVEQSRALVREAPLDLIVWSETAIDEYLERTPERVAEVAMLAEETGVPVLTGAPRERAGRFSNAVVLFTPGDGLAESYDKQRLVPFSEMDPWWGAWLAPLLGPVTSGEPYTPGLVPVVFRQTPVPLATPVCFEITDPHLVRELRENGAQVLVNLSNDAWFGRTGYAEMHFAHAIFRAVELRVPVIRGANTGVSGIIDAGGRVVATLPVFTEGTIRGTVIGTRRSTVYGVAGDLPFFALTLAPLLALALWGRPRSAPGDRSA